LVRLLKAKKYIFRHQDKKKFMSFVGFLLKFKRIPGCGYIPIVFESLTALDEFASTIIPSISITDSNFNSSDVMIPLAGNDESMVCLNFFTYFVTRIIFVSKLKHFIR
jgi:ribosomal protein S2